MKYLKKTIAVFGCTLLASTLLALNVFANPRVEYPEEFRDDSNKGNCVAFVKYSMGVDPEKNISSWNAKVSLISDPEHGRSVSICPEPGWLAIVDTRASQPEGQKYGHIAYVEDADEDSGRITVVTLDGNWNGKVARRTGTPSELRIKGYWEP